MYEREEYQRIVARLAARAVGLDPIAPLRSAAQQRAARYHADVVALPAVPVPPIQNADGTFVAMDGYSVYDGGEEYGS